MTPWTADSTPPFGGGVTADSRIYLADGSWILDNAPPTPPAANQNLGTVIPGIGVSVYNQPCSVQGSTIFP